MADVEKHSIELEFDYFDILYDMFETMETEETTISDEKSTFPDGRPSSASSAGDCDNKTSSAPAGAKLELGLSLAKIFYSRLDLLLQCPSNCR